MKTWLRNVNTTIKFPLTDLVYT